MKHNKDLNEKEAKKIVKQNKEDNKVGTETKSIFGKVGEGFTKDKQAESEPTEV